MVDIKTLECHYYKIIVFATKKTPIVLKKNNLVNRNTYHRFSSWSPFESNRFDKFISMFALPCLTREMHRSSALRIIHIQGNHDY
jgi:hypothetical protein